jgi:Protein O-mannosyl-transferase TMEM260-like
MQPMIRRHWVNLSLLVSAIGLTRFAFRSHYLYDIDSVNFGLGMERFDPRVYQPHPPGYFLYICMGRVVTLIVHDANLALVLLSIVASCGTVVLIYRMALAWFGLRAALLAGLLFVFSPLAWFHGTVALTYSVEAFFSALLGYLCWRIYSGDAKFFLPTGIMLGVSAGVRPSSLLFLGPLFLLSLSKVRTKARILALAALVATLAAWFFPMIWASGGFHTYFGALISLWRLVPSKGTVFNSSPANSIARACTIVLIYFLAFGVASLAPLAALGRSLVIDREKKIFTLFWIAPALCFFTLIFLKFVNSGYLLLLSAPGCIWLGYLISEWSRSTGRRRGWKLGVIAAGAVANVIVFLASPFYCSYRSVRRFEAQLDAIRTALPQVGSADDTVIVGFDSHFLGYRHAGYYLPGYLTVQFPEVKLMEGTRIFAMQKRNTRLLKELPAAAYSRFILFPLPGGEVEYRKYLQIVKEPIPSKNLRTVHVGGYDFVTGPVSDLPLLFPQAAPAARQSVYVLLHPGQPPVNSRAH